MYQPTLFLGGIQVKCQSSSNQWNIFLQTKKKMLQYGIYNLSTGSSIYSLYATNYDVHMGNGDVMNYNNVAGPEMDTKRY